jgi:dCMP deaminase
MTDHDILREALAYAAITSPHCRTKVGAVIKTGKRLVYAANVPPPGTPREAYDRYEHAERAAIYKAAAAGVPTAGATLYAPWFACPECARAIILAGIAEVVGLVALDRATPERWRAAVADGLAVLHAGGVGTRWVADRVGATILFDGRPLEC